MLKPGSVWGREVSLVKTFLYRKKTPKHGELRYMPQSIHEAERFIKGKIHKGYMAAKEASYVSGLSFLSDREMINLEGQCVAVVDGKVAYSHTSPERVLAEMKKLKGKEKIFTCVPDSKATLVK